MKLFVHSSPKKGENLENNQDSISFDSKKKLFSVCDGVSVFAGAGSDRHGSDRAS